MRRLGDRWCAVLQGVSVPGGDHQPLCVAVSPLLTELPRDRGDDAAARDHRQPRDGPAVVCQVRPVLRQQPAPAPGSPGDKGHVDEVFIKIRGKTHYLWRAVDQQGSVLDILVTSRRDTRAATRFFPKLLTGLEYVPRVLITDKLASYGAARRRVLRSVEHRQSKYLNNRGREFASTDPGA